jgi:hypothetical protein
MYGPVSPRRNARRLYLRPTHRTIEPPSPAASGILPAAQEQKQINDLTGKFELCICNIGNQCSGTWRRRTVTLLRNFPG